MLRIYPDERATAAEMLKHPWLNMETTDFFVTVEEIY